MDYASQPVVFIQDKQHTPVDTFHEVTWNASYLGHGGSGSALLPHVEVGSGREISHDWVSFYNVYKGMIDREMDVPSQADILASYRRVGDGFNYRVTVTNRSGVALSNNNGARLSVIAYETGDFDVTSHFLARGFTIMVFYPALANGATANYALSITSLSGVVNWNNLHHVVLLDYEPAGWTYWVNMQAAVATLATSSDLSVTASAKPTLINKGDVFTYTLTAHNAGLADATGVVLTDPLPAAVSFVSASPGCTNTSGTVTCSVGNLNFNASKIYNLRVLTDQAGVSIKNTVTIDGEQPDPDATNNTSVLEIEAIETIRCFLPLLER